MAPLSMPIMNDGFTHGWILYGLATTMAAACVVVFTVLMCACCGKQQSEKAQAADAKSEGKHDSKKEDAKGPGPILTGKEPSTGESSKTSSSISGKTGHTPLPTVKSFKLKRPGSSSIRSQKSTKGKSGKGESLKAKGEK